MGPIRDRGVIKWQSAMLLPEHVKKLKEFYQEVHRVQKPILDEQKSSKMDEFLREAMEFNTSINFTIFKDGELLELKGYIHFIDIINKEYRIRDFQNANHYLAFDEIVEVTRN